MSTTTHNPPTRRDLTEILTSCARSSAHASSSAERGGGRASGATVACSSRNGPARGRAALGLPGRFDPDRAALPKTAQSS